MKRSGWIGVGVFGSALILVMALCSWRSHQEIRRAERYVHAEQEMGSLPLFFVLGPANPSSEQEVSALLSDYLLQEASRHYARALKWQVQSEEAHRGLRGVANRAERSGLTARALEIYRQYRSAIMATDHLWQPRSKDLPWLNERIVTLLAGSEPDRQRWLQELQEPRPFFRGWQLGLIVAFFAWVASVTWLVWHGFDKSGKPRPRKLGGALAVSMMLLGIWLTCLSQIKLGK